MASSSEAASGLKRAAVALGKSPLSRTENSLGLRAVTSPEGQPVHIALITEQKAVARNLGIVALFGGYCEEKRIGYTARSHIHQSAREVSGFIRRKGFVRNDVFQQIGWEQVELEGLLVGVGGGQFNAVELGVGVAVAQAPHKTHTCRQRP